MFIVGTLAHVHIAIQVKMCHQNVSEQGINSVSPQAILKDKHI